MELVIGAFFLSCNVESCHFHVSKFAVLRKCVSRNSSNDCSDEVSSEAFSDVCHQRKLTFGEGVEHERGGGESPHCEYHLGVAEDEIPSRGLQNAGFAIGMVDLFNEAIYHYFKS